MNQANCKKYGTKTLSDVAALAKKDPGAVTLCVESEFANRADGLPGMEKAYGMTSRRGEHHEDGRPAIIYTQVGEGQPAPSARSSPPTAASRRMNLKVLEDDKKFFPNYNAAPEMNSETMKKYPAIAEVLAPVTKELNNTVAQELNAQGGRATGRTRTRWRRTGWCEEGFIKEG